jgi:alpha-L-arabinofuranosidase
LLTSSVARSPKVSSSKGDSFDALQTYATRDAQGNVYLVVINVDPARDISATVATGSFTHGRTATVSTLASPNINDENTLANPTFVAIRQRTADVGTGNFELSFPKHSVTAIRLSTQ